MSRIIDNNPASPVEADAFDEAMRVMLSSVYKPPVPRGNFKAELFGRLKVQQAALAAVRRRRKIRVFTFSTALAAAASVMLMLAVAPGTPGIMPGASSTPSLMVKADLVSAFQAEIAGRVEVLGKDGVWAPAAGLVSVNTPLQLRTLDTQAGITLKNNVQVVMEKGSQLYLDTNSLTVKSGLMRVQLLKGATPLTVQLTDHELSLTSGSSVQVAIQDAAKFAPGGQPAPDVTVLAGTAMVKGLDSTVAPVSLLAGRKYQLHNYHAFDRLGGERLDERVLNDQNRWLKPQLVRFLTDK